MCPLAGQSHERAAKIAETDATKRALATFGNPFGLSLYSGKIPKRRTPADNTGTKEQGQLIPEVSADDAATDRVSEVSQNEKSLSPGIDKSVLLHAEPKRRRCEAHLQYIRAQACLICGRSSSHAHHLRFAQPKAMGRKVSDEYTVPLCAIHHDQLHRHGNETAWWARHKINALAIAESLWTSYSRGEETRQDVNADKIL